jgi:hypothetical protein
MLKQRSTVHNLNTEDDLKILLRIQSIIILNITSLNHLGEKAVYVCTTHGTIRIRSATDCRVIRKFAFSIGRSTSNTHLLSGISFLSTWEYQVPGVEVSKYRCTAIRRVGRSVAVRRGSLVYIYIGDRQLRRFDFGRSGTSDTRGWVFG